ncbi:phosphate ABC transporter substrate-binding protein [Pyxidicoccus sp. MSG2]|uniref:phosphate ABC transporter substrate-binding protein n=1 Tax=Pyxidicoccus sp. MSG2 TaxID=2996790 RepID=UPI0022702C12|nr:phosphate ABC transporter substrate-binding protein [Pyxidicoccus sp. MSG2]MCY1015744.1 phosphate ABC transporter substrate-binding protein [Pyxidicoccus sp. MSG2]
MPPPVSQSPRASARSWPAALAALLLLASCEQATRAPSALAYAGSGTISDTVLPALSRGFVDAGGVPVDARFYVGSSAGMRMVLEGQADLAGLARAPKSTEKALNPYYVIFAYDALAVLVHPDNPVKDLTRAQVKALFTGQVKNWRELGGHDGPVERVTVELNSGSGSVDFFRETVMEGASFGPGRVIPHPDDCQRYVASHRDAVTFLSLSQGVEGVRRLALDGVEATPATVRTADYPLSRPLVLATRGVPEGSLRAFLDFVMSPPGQALVARTFVPVHADR